MNRVSLLAIYGMRKIKKPNFFQRVFYTRNLDKKIGNVEDLFINTKAKAKKA